MPIAPSIATALSVATLAALTSCATSPPRPAPADHPAHRTISRLHAAAAAADGDAYFALFTPGAVFLGTDPDERWSVAEFRAYADPHFTQGKGWTYREVWRHFTIAPSGDVAWFDEELAHDTYGRCRGSGVLLRDGDGGAWRIAQYNLTIPIPNDLARESAERFRAHSAARGTIPPTDAD